VHQLLFNEKGVIALGARGVHMALRRGPPAWPHIRWEQLLRQCYTRAAADRCRVVVPKI
jgi:hypothetical protein